jgi:hypothetical protein
MKRFVVVLTVWAMGIAGVLAGVVFPSSASAATPTGDGAYGSVAPTRLLDTRIGTGAAKAAVAPSGTVSFKVTGGNVPTTASAVVLNVTVAHPAKAGFITAFATGKARPGVSNLNFLANQTVANLVVAPVSATGMVSLFNGSAGGTFLIADVSGYYRSGAPTDAGAFGSVAPVRMLDTRIGTGAAKGAVASKGTVDLQIVGRGGVPAGVSAVVLNVTATGSTTNGAVTVYGTGTDPRPSTSNLNFARGQTVPNLVIAPVSASGKVSLYNDSLGSTSLIADAFGYFKGGTPVTTGAYGSVVPNRLLDTRDGTGTSSGAPFLAVAANGSVNLNVTGSGVPAGASAVVLNVTATQPAQAGFITVFGAGATKPLASNLNFLAHQTVPNLVIAPVSADGRVTLFNGSTGATHLIADISGYYLGSDVVPAVTSAVLSINGSTGTAKTSANGFEPSFDVTGSLAGSDQTIVSGSLNYGDGTTDTFSGDPSNWNVTHGYTAAGDLTVTLQVTDSSGDSASDSVALTVYAAPTATITASAPPVRPGDLVTFALTSATPTGTAFTDYDVSYGDDTPMEFKDGVPPATLTHAFTAEGTYTVTFEAYNDADGWVTASTTVTLDTTPPGPVTDLQVKLDPDGAKVIGKDFISLVWTNPLDADFTGVEIRRMEGATAPTRTTGTLVTDLTNDPVAYVVDVDLTAGTQYSYAFFAHDAVGNYAAAATVTDTTTGTPPETVPPGPVTDLTAAVVTDTSIKLDWVNPTDADFAGVTIRRLEGATAPSATTGDELTVPASATATSFTDTGLAAGTEYSYAVFSYDTAGNHAAAVNVTPTATTKTTSVELLVDSTRITVDSSLDFDASLSYAGTGETLSGSLDYGDGTAPEALNGDPYGWFFGHSFSTTGAKTVTLTVTDSAGTTLTKVITVNVFAAPTASITIAGPVVPIHVGDAVTFTLGSSTPAGTAFTDWSVRGDLFGEYKFGTPAPATYTQILTASGTVTVTFERNNDAMGTALASVDVTVLP